MRGGGIAACGRDLGECCSRAALHVPAASQRERPVGQLLGVVPAPGAKPAVRRLAQ
jgi:hypothetical protein